MFFLFCFPSTPVLRKPKPDVIVLLLDMLKGWGEHLDAAYMQIIWQRALSKTQTSCWCTSLLCFAVPPQAPRTHTPDLCLTRRRGGPPRRQAGRPTLVKQSTTFGNTKQNIRKRFLRRPKRAGFFLCNFQKGRSINGVLGHVFRVHVLPF